LTRSQLLVRRGAQRPRLSSVPAFRESSGPEVTDLAGRAGLVLDDWQAWVLEQGLGERTDGDWAAFEAAVVVPRQNGKGAIIEALCLAGLFLFEDRLTIYSAHEFKTAQETYRRIDELIAGQAWLSKRVVRRVQSTNESGFELDNGCRLRFLARSKGSGRGFSSRRLIFDEAYDLPASAMGAVLPTLSAQPNPQIWYFSSAGQEDSDVLRSIRTRGIEGSPRLFYAEWSAPDGSDPTDMDAVAVANPGLGIRISEQFIRDEQAALDADEFGREVMGFWDEPEFASGVIPAEAWARSLNPTSDIAGPPVFGLDVAPLRDSAAVGVAGATEAGLCQVEITGSDGLIDHRPGTDWVVPRLIDMASRWSTFKVVIAAGQGAEAFRPQLEAAGIDVVALNGTEVAQACGSFHDLVTSGRLVHLGQPELDGALRGARRIDRDGAWILGRRKSAVDIVPAYAAILAAWGHTSDLVNSYDVLDSFF